MDESNNDKSYLLNALEKFTIHDHLCLIYESGEEQLEAVVPFISIGLERKEQCIYIADDNSSAAVLDALRAAGTDVDAAVKSNALKMITKRESYLRLGHFDPDIMIRFLKEAMESARKAGFKALRVNGEMTWAAGKEPGVNRFVEYEAKLNNFFSENNVLAMCQYNRRHFKPEIIRDAIRTHQIVIYSHLVCKNPYYIPPGEFFKMGGQVSVEVERLLNNIQERKQMETALQKANEKINVKQRQTAKLARAFRKERDTLRVIMENTGAQLAYLDSKFNFIKVNSAYVQGSGHARYELIGRNHFELFPSPENQAIFERVRDTAEAVELKAKPFEYPDQPWRGVTYWDWTLTPIKDASGKVDRLVLSLTDVTESKRAEQTIREERDKAQKYLDVAGTIIVVIDTNQKVVLINKKGCEILGYNENEIVGRNWFDSFFPERIKNNIKAAFDGLMDGEVESVEYSENPVLTRGGEEKIIAWHNTLLRDDGGGIIASLSSGEDITERKKVEDELRKHRENLAQLVEARTAELTAINRQLKREITERKLVEGKVKEQAELLDKAHDAIGVRDLEHRLIYWNKGAEHLYGWTAGEALGRNANELLYEEESARLIEARKAVIERGEWIGELNQVTKGGKKITVESRWTLVRDDRGNPKSILIINTDITEKKTLEAQFLRAQRMESIGTLAGGIAHDINNVLTPIMLSLELLRGKCIDEQSQKLLEILETNTQRGANLVKQVMSFARGVGGERNVLQVVYLIAEIEKILKETFPKSIEIRTDVEKDLWNVSGDITQLHQVLMNLCVNAKDAMHSGGILRLCAENFFIDETYARMNIDARTGPYIVITVSDTGAGIPPKILDRIFEPFFTTKELGKGTGLGLSTALAIVKSHGGFLNVYSEVGEGTAFRVYLPAIKAETQKAEEQKPLLHTGRGELILVVDDEAPIREITSATLETNAYRVITAGDGVEAITMYVQNMEEIKLVLMDMAMPNMDGLACIRALQKINPGVKIIAVSGLTEKDKLAKIADAHVSDFLCKPYTTEKLLKKVQEVLH